MKIRRWLKKTACLLLVWTLMLGVTSGVPVSHAQEMTVSAAETETGAETVPETEFLETEAQRQESEGTETVPETPGETLAARESETASQYRQIFDGLAADVLSFYWQVYAEEMQTNLNREEYDQLQSHVQQRAVERVQPEGSAAQEEFAAAAPERQNQEAAQTQSSGSYQGTSGMYTLGNNVNLATLGRNGKDVWMVTLDGETAFCMDMELLAHSGNTYVRTGTTDDAVIRRAVAYYGMTNPTPSGYEYAQLYIWCGGNSSLFVRTMFEYGLSKYDNRLYTPQKLLSMSLLEMNQELNRLDAGFASALGQAYQDLENQDTAGLADVYVFYGPSGYQRFATLYQGVWVEEETPEPSAEPEYSSVAVSASASVSFEAAVVKTDEQTAQGLAGVVFAVYRDGVYVGEVTTDENGRAAFCDREMLEARSDEISYCSNYDELDEETQSQIEGCKSEAEARALAQAQANERLAALKSAAVHTYTFVEAEAREGYYKDPDNDRAEMTIRAGESEETALTNRPTQGEIRLLKQDLEAEASAAQGTASLEGAIYDLYVGESDIAHPDGKTGTAVYLGTVYEGGQWIERETELKAGALVASAQIKDGELAFSSLYLGDYVIRERAKRTVTVSGTDMYGQTFTEIRSLSYAEGYLCDPEDHPVTLSWPGESYELEIVAYPQGASPYSDAVHVTESEICVSREQVIKSAFRLSKLGTEAGQTQGEALAGAGFSVYRVDLLSRAEEFTRGENGLYNLSSVLEAYRNENYSDQEAKYDFSGEEEARAVLYAEEEEVKAYNESLTDGTSGMGEGLVPTGRPGEYMLQEIFTGETGVIQSPLLPYGQYLVAETTVPDDHFMVDPFLVTVGELSPTEIHQPVLYLLDEEFEAYLKVVKIDKDTGLSVLRPGASYRIWDLEGERYVTQRVFQSGSMERTEIFAADENGVLILGERLPAGRYRLEEETAPEGFYNEWAAEGEGTVTFEISTGRAYEATGEQTADGRDIVVIRENYENRETRGRLTIRKEGEILAGYEEGQFVYETAPLAGAVFEVRAAQDIVTQDHQTTEGAPALWYEEGELVATVITGEEGDAQEIIPSGDNPITQVIRTGTAGEVSLVLPLGKYVVTEVEAPYGFALALEPVTVEFVWEGQTQEFVYNSWWESQSPDGKILFTDWRVKTEQKEDSGILGIGVFKEDTDTKEPVAGAVYGLYTKDDIYDAQGERIAQAGELLAMSEPTDDEGFAGFSVDVPLRAEDWSEGVMSNSGRYILREEISPDGYLLNPEEILVEFLYEGQEKEYVFTAGTGRDKQTQMQISKRDIAGSEELPGCKLQVLEIKEDDGERRLEPVESWLSGDEPKILRGLKLCSQERETIYVLRELQPADGYVTAEDIYFRLWQAESEETGAPTVKVEVWMPQSDAAGPSGYIMMPAAVPDGESDAEECEEAAKTIAAASWHVIGDVLVIEVNPQADEEKLSRVLTEERFARIDFQKVYIAAENELLFDGLFAEKRTDNAPQAEETGWSWQETGDGLVAMYDEKTSGLIEKIDCLTGEPVVGAVLALTDEEGRLVEKWVTTKSGHEIEGLTPGIYTLTELSAPAQSSYSVMAPVRFAVEDTADQWQLVVLEDHVRFSIDKIDGESGESLAGAVLRLVYLGADDGEQMGTGDGRESWATEFTTRGEPVLFANMMPGRYRLTEVSAPDGYEIAASVEFIVTDSWRTQEFTLENHRVPVVRTETPQNPETRQTASPQTGDSGEAVTYGVAVLAAAGCISVVLWIQKKRGKREGI